MVIGVESHLPVTVQAGAAAITIGDGHVISFSPDGSKVVIDGTSTIALLADNGVTIDVGAVLSLISTDNRVGLVVVTDAGTESKIGSVGIGDVVLTAFAGSDMFRATGLEGSVQTGVGIKTGVHMAWMGLLVAGQLVFVM